MRSRPASSVTRRPRRLRWTALVGCALLAATIVDPSGASATGKQPKKTNGAYDLTVRGSCTGEGQGTVAGGRVSIRIPVEDEAGNKGMLIAEGLMLDGGHFQGAGTVFGRPATFSGRLDGYDGDKHFRRARLLCSFAEADARAGRIAGARR